MYAVLNDMIEQAPICTNFKVMVKSVTKDFKFLQPVYPQGTNLVGSKFFNQFILRGQTSTSNV